MSFGVGPQTYFDVSAPGPNMEVKEKFFNVSEFSGKTA